MSMQTLFRDTFVLQRATVSQDALGGSVRTWSDVTSFAGMLVAHGDERMTTVFQRSGNQGAGQILSYVNPTAEVGDRVSGAGQTFRVAGQRSMTAPASPVKTLFLLDVDVLEPGE